MVWARTKLVIWEYVFEPTKSIEISFSGKFPERYYKKINELIRSVFNIPDAYVQEKSYNWEKLKGTERFDVNWEANKPLDLYTFLTVDVVLKGFSTEGEGSVKIAVKPRMITEYPQDTILQQNLVYEILRRIWHKLFYQHRRMEHLNKCKELIVNFEQSLKEFARSLE